MARDRLATGHIPTGSAVARPTRRAVLASSAGLIASAALAQPAGPPVVAFLGFSTEVLDRPQVTAFREGLAAAGRIEGRNVRVISRHAEGDLSRAVDLIRELVKLPVSVFLAPGPAAARMIRRNTDTPVVAVGLPPVASEPELFASVAKPGGSVTGFSGFGETLAVKRLEIIRELLPGLRSIGILHNATDPIFRDWGVQTADFARSTGIEPVQIGLHTTDRAPVEEAVATFRARGARAVIVVRDFLTHTLIGHILAATTQARIAAVSETAAHAEAGALMSFGADFDELFRRSGAYVDRILNGTPPGDLPIEVPIKPHFILNLTVARRLDITVPPAVLARADDVID